MKASLPIAKELMNDGSVAATMKLVAGCVAVVLFLFYSERSREENENEEVRDRMKQLPDIEL